MPPPSSASFPCPLPARSAPARTGLLRWRLLVGLCVTAVAAAVSVPAATTPAAAQTDTVYVSPSGDDNAAGTSDAPLRTIGAAVSRTPDGGGVVVASGTYHESVALQGHSGRSITAAPGADVWLDGSSPVTAWAPSGSTWVSGGWNAQFDSSPTFTRGAPDGAAPYWQFVNPAHPMAAHPDQLWVDDVAQAQVGSLAQVQPGTFYVDYAAHRLYLGSDPTGHDVRASDLAKALTIQDPGATITGINVRRYADSVPTLGAVTVERPDAVLSTMQIIDNATTGLGVFSSGARVDHVTLDENGMHGLLANQADGLRLNQLRVFHNNSEQFNTAPSAGGVKITRSSDVEVRGSEFSDNLGTGLWLDESVYDFAIIGSRFADNLGHGISLEISGTGAVLNNMVTGNTGDGVKVNDTDKVRIWNNTLTGNGRSINIVQDDRDQDAGGSYRDTSLPLTLRSQNLSVHNNILASARASADCLLCVEDYTHRFSAAEMHINVDGNLYQQPTESQPRWLVVWSRGPGNPAVFTTLAEMRTATGYEKRGRLVRRTAVLSSTLQPTYAVQRLVRWSAYFAPLWMADQARVRPGAQRLGSWRS